MLLPAVGQGVASPQIWKLASACPEQLDPSSTDSAEPVANLSLLIFL